ncbi:MAG: hypothetical protein AAF551_11920, partial [Bacteroidota bacterium]
MRKVSFLLITLFSFGLFAQEIDEKDSTKLGSITPILSDSIANSIQPEDTTRNLQKNDIETTINYNARDSMYFDLVNRKLYMYGETHIDYGEIALDADLTSVDWEKRSIESDFSVD